MLNKLLLSTVWTNYYEFIDVLEAIDYKHYDFYYQMAESFEHRNLVLANQLVIDFIDDENFRNIFNYSDYALRNHLDCFRKAEKEKQLDSYVYALLMKLMLSENEFFGNFTPKLDIDSISGLSNLFDYINKHSNFNNPLNRIKPTIFNTFDTNNKLIDLFNFVYIPEQNRYGKIIDIYDDKNDFDIFSYQNTIITLKVHLIDMTTLRYEDTPKVFFNDQCVGLSNQISINKGNVIFTFQ